MDATIRRPPDVDAIGSEAIEPDRADAGQDDVIAVAAARLGSADTRPADRERHPVIVPDGDYAIEVADGDLGATANNGRITIEAMQSITLKVGQSSITIDQTGITIRGLVVDIEGALQAGVKGLTTEIKGAGLLQMGGGLTRIG